VIPPDNEIFEVESRIAAHRAQLKRSAQDAKVRALQKMASPGALAAAAALGFLLAAAMARRNQKPSHPERRKSDHLKAAKATGIVGMVLPAAMWLVRAQWGSPMRAAQLLLEKMGKGKPKGKPRVSPRADTSRDTRSTIHP
jgi:hypothetical protein